VSDEHLSRELAAPVAGTSPGRATAAHANLVAAQRIAAVLDLPANSKVLRVRGRPVSSADAAIEELQSAFGSEAGVVTLDLQTPNGPGRVYLMREKALKRE
jgi:predicted lipid-binding transport protein (Tim44 family)